MNIPRTVFRLVEIATDEKPKYGISGVHIKRDGIKCVAEATDGRRLGIIRWKDTAAEGKRADTFDCILSRPMCVYARIMPSKTGLVTLKEPGGLKTVELSTMADKIRYRISGEVVLGEFPDVDAVIPEPPTEPGDTMYVDLCLFGPLVDVLIRGIGLEKATETATVMMRPDKTRPIRIDVENPQTGMSATGVIMSMAKGGE